MTASLSDPIEIRDRATGALLGTVPISDADDTRAAIARAQQALDTWSRLPAPDRAAILRRWAELILDDIDSLALGITQEQGKPLAEAMAEIRSAAAYVIWFAEEARRAYGETIPAPREDTRLLTVRRPVGVVAAITPWNFPASMVTRKLAPALAAGCTAVLKPSELTPLTALALVDLAYRAGVSRDALHCMVGDPEIIGPVLTGHPAVRKLSFTGSTRVGKLLAAQSAATMKRVSMELGGNAPFLIFDDADLPAAIDGLMTSKFRNSGQTCICANRIIVQRGVHDRLVSELTARVAALRVGAGAEPGVEQGPLINEAAVAKVEQLVEGAVGDGARALVGGRRHDHGGTFYQPTLLDGVRPEMEIAKQEIFGPVAAVIAFGTEEEAVAIANASASGLAGYAYTRDLARFWRLVDRLEVGMLGFNTGTITNEASPFGGVKESSLGREGSRYGLDDYLDIKSVTIGGLA